MYMYSCIGYRHHQDVIGVRGVADNAVMAESFEQRARGIVVALGGVLAVSPDAMLLRWMRSLGASSPDVAVAKYVGIIACMVVIGYVRGLSSARQSMPHFIASAFSQLLYQLTFTFCLLLTDAAKALLLISLAPLWRDRPR